MSTPSDTLLVDARKSIGRALLAATDLDLADRAFAACLLRDSYPLTLDEIVSAGIEQRTQGYRQVAALGFLSKLIGAGCSFIKELQEALGWISNRPMSICGATAGFVSDPVALLGIAFGASSSGCTTSQAEVRRWLDEVLAVRRTLPALEEWEQCILAAVATCLRRPDSIYMPEADGVADCRLALRALNAIPDAYPAELQRDEASLVRLLLDDPEPGLSFPRLVMRAAAYDDLKRRTLTAGRVAAGHDLASVDGSDHKKVFVSYAWEDDGTHQPRVVRFTNDLREYGLDAIVDVFESSPPNGWPMWMLKQIQRADFVLMVITETYRRRFEGDEQPGVGKGVKWEGGIVTREVYDSEFRNDKFLPVVFGKQHLASMPTIFKGNTHWDVSDPERLKELVMFMTGQPLYIPARLGSIPVLPPRSV